MTTIRARIREFTLISLGIFVAITVMACSASSEGGIEIGDPGVGTGVGTSATAVATVFIGGPSASVSKFLLNKSMVKKAVDVALDESDTYFECDSVNDPNCTCASADIDEGPSSVQTGLYGDPEVYGADGNNIYVSTYDFCTLPDGTENAGMGPDGIGRLATFELDGEVIGTCTEDSDTFEVAMQAGSSGVWRNTDTYYPQIFGTFTFVVDNDNEYTLDCTIYLNDDETVAEATCTDEVGDVVEMEEDTSCDFSGN